MINIDSIKKLSLEKAKEVEDFIEFLIQKEQNQPTRKNRPFGLCKGEFQISDDFNEPLDKNILKEWGML
jgi:hypothetical protein